MLSGIQSLCSCGEGACGEGKGDPERCLHDGGRLCRRREATKSHREAHQRPKAKGKSRQ